MASPRVGDLAPDFSLPSTQGEISLSQRCKRRSVLLVFYPGDETPVCTKQLCDYQDHLGVFEDLGVDVLAINPQSLESHEKFAANHDLSFPLVGTDQRVRYSRVDLPIFHRSAAELEEVIEDL